MRLSNLNASADNVWTWIRRTSLPFTYLFEGEEWDGELWLKPMSFNTLERMGLFRNKKRKKHSRISEPKPLLLTYPGFEPIWRTPEIESYLDL